jgi:rhodanese-related sulfurtransferase
MTKAQIKVQVLIAGMIILGGLLPLGLYWLALGRLPAMMPAQALEMLNNVPDSVVLVDVRQPAEFARQRVEGAQNIPLEQVLGWSALDQLPANLSGRTLLIICSSGWDSAQAARHLISLGRNDIFTIRGGMQEWAKAAWRVPDAHFSHFIGDGLAPYLVVERMPPTLQATQVLAGFAIKPLYMFISLVLALLLLQEHASDLTALRRGLWAFFVGESFCYVNFLIFHDDSYLSEFLHSYGMVVGFGFILYALLEGIDRRAIHYNDLDKRCTAMGLCLSCSRYRSVVCRARRAYQLFIPVLALLACMPLLARFHSDGYTGLIFGVQYFYGRFGVYQFYENRVLPVMALACFALGYLPLWRKRSNPAVSFWTQVFTAAGMGALSFSLIRLALSTMYSTNLVWFDFWEETTELIFVVAIGAVLWLFREALFSKGIFHKVANLIEF